MAQSKVNHGGVSTLERGNPLPAIAKLRATNVEQQPSPQKKQPENVRTATEDELRERLRGSPELMGLVHEVVKRRRLQDVEFSDEWREALAKDLAQFND